MLANAGGVRISYFEWVQDISAFFWSEDEIERVSSKIEARRLRGGLGCRAKARVSCCGLPPLSWVASVSSRPASCAASTLSEPYGHDR